MADYAMTGPQRGRRHNSLGSDSKVGRPCSFCLTGKLIEKTEKGRTQLFCDTCDEEHHFVEF